MNNGQLQAQALTTTVADGSPDDYQMGDVPESLGRQAWLRFRRHPLAVVGVITLLILVFAFFAGPFFLELEFDERNIADRAQGPSRKHPFGTDDLGRDLLVRSLRGGRYSLFVALITAVIATTIGLLLGAAAGYFGKWVDGTISFIVNSLLTIPLILILIIFGRQFGSRAYVVALLIASLSWLRPSRLVRAQVLQLKEQDFVQAAIASGATSSRIIFKHLLPNLVGILLVEITLLAGTAIILESTLSFLGLGVQPPDTTLGTLISDAKGSIDTRPSRVLIPGGIVTAIILSFNFIGDALRDALDPKAGTE